MIKSRIISSYVVLNSCLYLYCLAFTADWLFYLKASHARGKTRLEHTYARAQNYAHAKLCSLLHYVFSPTVTTSYPRSNESAVYLGADEGEGGAEQQQHLFGSCLQKLKPSFWGLAPNLKFAVKLFSTPFSLSDPSSTTGRHLFYSWTLYSTVLYLGHCVSFFLEYIMLENTPLSYFLKWIATEAELCCKTRQSRTFCNALASIQTFG